MPSSEPFRDSAQGAAWRCSTRHTFMEEGGGGGRRGGARLRARQQLRHKRAGGGGVAQRGARQAHEQVAAPLGARAAVQLPDPVRRQRQAPLPPAPGPCPHVARRRCMPPRGARERSRQVADAGGRKACGRVGRTLPCALRRSANGAATGAAESTPATCPACAGGDHAETQTPSAAEGARRSSSATRRSSAATSASPSAPGLAAGTNSRSKYRWQGRASRITCAEEQPRLAARPERGPPWSLPPVTCPARAAC